MLVLLSLPVLWKRYFFWLQSLSGMQVLHLLRRPTVLKDREYLERKYLVFKKPVSATVTATLRYLDILSSAEIFSDNNLIIVCVSCRIRFLNPCIHPSFSAVKCNYCILHTESKLLMSKIPELHSCILWWQPFCRIYLHHF